MVTGAGWGQHRSWNLEVMGNLRITQKSGKVEELVRQLQGMGINSPMRV